MTASSLPLQSNNCEVALMTFAGELMDRGACRLRIGAAEYSTVISADQFFPLHSTHTLAVCDPRSL